MVSAATWIRYLINKAEYSYYVCWKSYTAGIITEKEAGDAIFKHFFQGRLTFQHAYKGKEMAPTIGTYLVRKIPAPSPERVSVGDVVILRDPQKATNILVRRLAALEGYQMASTDEKDEPFVLEENQCWVLADSEDVKPKDANDSRTFGPVRMDSIMGRVIYCLRSAVDHGPVNNSKFSMEKDSPVLEVELDVDELAKNHKA